MPDSRDTHQLVRGEIRRIALEDERIAIQLIDNGNIVHPQRSQAQVQFIKWQQRVAPLVAPQPVERLCFIQNARVRMEQDAALSQAVDSRFSQDQALVIRAREYRLQVC